MGNDRIFACLLACDYGIPYCKLGYLTYMLQYGGLDLDYIYVIKCNKLESKGLHTSLNTVKSLGLVDMHGQLTADGRDWLCRYVTTAESTELFDLVCELCLSYNKDELYVICVTDILIQEALERGGVSLLRGEKEAIMQRVESISVCYTDRLFDKAVGIMENIRRRRL